MARRASGLVGLAAVHGLAAREADPGTTVPARSTVRGATARGATVPLPTARGRSRPVPRDRVVRTIAGAPPDHGPIEVGRVGREGGARVPGRNAGVLGPTMEVRGPDRAIDSDRGRGSVRGRTGARMSVVTGPATNRGAPMIAQPDLAETSGSGRALHATPAVRATDRARVGRPPGAHSPGDPSEAGPKEIGPIGRGRAPIARIRSPKATSAAVARPDRQPCHRRRRSDPRRSSLPGGARSKKRSSPDAPRSGSWSCRSAEPLSRSSCSTRRTCVSRSSKSKVAP